MVGLQLVADPGPYKSFFLWCGRPCRRRPRVRFRRRSGCYGRAWRIFLENSGRRWRSPRPGAPGGNFRKSTNRKPGRHASHPPGPMRPRICKRCCSPGKWPGAANKAAGFDETPPGMTWHHNEDGVTMELVPSKLNNNVPHDGGASVVKSPEF